MKSNVSAQDLMQFLVKLKKQTSSGYDNYMSVYTRNDDICFLRAVVTSTIKISSVLHSVNLIEHIAINKVTKLFIFMYHCGTW